MKARIFTAVLAALVLITAAGCGRQVDRALAKTDDKIDDTVDKLRK